MKILVKNILIGMMAFGSLVSCEKYLEETYTAGISPTNFYKTAEDFDGALKGIYPTVNSALTSRSQFMSEVFSWYCGEPEPMEQIMAMYGNNPSEEFYCFRETWSQNYSIVNNANTIIAKAEKAKLSDAEKTQIIAEAKFFRAFGYFNLVQYFGDIPLRTESITTANEVLIGRSSQAEIYAQILSDIEASLEMSETSPALGRVNKYVAKGLCARIYLTIAGYPMNKTEYYAKAKQMALDVIAGPYSLLGSYDQLFHNNTYNAETIWAILYDSPTYSNNDMHKACSPKGSGTASILPSEYFTNLFAKGDQRKEWGIVDGYTNAEGKEVIARPYFNKYIVEEYHETDEGVSATGICGYQFDIMRLAEMYLIAAEAENEVNGPADAYQYINKIRERARVDKADPTNVPDLAGLSQEQFREAVINERAFELYIEGGLSWFDMKRTQTFNKVTAARGSELINPIGAYNNTWLIPDTEMDSNDIEQNPMYLN